MNFSRGYAFLFLKVLAIQVWTLNGHGGGSFWGRDQSQAMTIKVKASGFRKETVRDALRRLDYFASRKH